MSSPAQPQPTPPWRPWSIPTQLPFMRRRLCGLLNKITKANLDSISSKIAALAVSVERTGDPDILDTFVRTIFQHSVSDPSRTRVYVELCQRVVDELERERSLWRKVDLFHLGNPMDCFETSLRLRAQYEFNYIIGVGQTETLRTFTGLVGELLVEELLFPDDVVAMVDTLFARASRDEEASSAALHRFLSRITVSFGASQLLISLDIAERLEILLEGAEHLSPKVRYTMMNILDQVLYPRPHDAFSSSLLRSEIYGIDVSDTVGSDTSSVAETPGASYISSNDNQYNTRQFLLTRDETAALEYLKVLELDQREVFISSLISAALSLGDVSDAQLVASLFSNHGVRQICEVEVFVNAFAPELSSLQDTIIDVPHATRLLAIMLQGSPLPPSAVERMATTYSTAADHGEDGAVAPVAERLLETYAVMIQSPGSRSGFTSSAASVEDLHGLSFSRSDSPSVSYGLAF
ncbi:hypothetical protein BXZ70DRAFT_910133 [Cristinia sonorae]|uniref:Uncharacterized protein n=1 Tax=Cristinia sonorae TaxID=1940300 RepID=A0A8K0UG95_9AGAR|nr:hypothetical protein BXZ70DRAFT_910133 [Cristinia sonorae]